MLSLPQSAAEETGLTRFSRVPSQLLWLPYSKRWSHASRRSTLWPLSWEHLSLGRVPMVAISDGEAIHVPLDLCAPLGDMTTSSALCVSI